MNTPTQFRCAVNGLIRPGAMCGRIVVEGNLCGYDGDCKHKRAETPPYCAKLAGPCPDGCDGIKVACGGDRLHGDCWRVKQPKENT